MLLVRANCKERNVLSVKTPVMDEGKMSPGHSAVNALMLLFG